MDSLKVEWLETCDSTSKVLKERVRDGLSAPLALAAGTQTAGIGRLGQFWQSLPGNLHFSLAVPAATLPAALRDLLPMAVGVVVADWLRSVAGVQCCLKWPNDLIIDGKKIGGILCEGLYHGQEFIGAVIGIGLNLNIIPAIEDSYPMGALKDLIVFSIAPRLAADQLAEKLIDQIPLWTRNDVLSRWRNAAIRPAHYWLPSEKQEWWRNTGVDDDGALVLERVSDDGRKGTSVAVRSVSHEFNWSVQMRRPMVVADVGNTSVKLALTAFDAKDDVMLLQDVILSGPGSLDVFLNAARQGGAAPVIHAISVNPNGFEALVAEARVHGFEVRTIAKNPVRATRSLYDLESIGIDRLAILEAAQLWHAKGTLPWPAVAVSLGTATTIDLIDGSGLHVGGFIAAGLQTSLAAVAGSGALLPKNLEMKLGRNEGLWPVTSADAMTEASIKGTLAFIKDERARLAQYCHVEVQTVTVILTGGFSGLMLERWTDGLVELRPSMALIGAALMVVNGR